MNQSKPFITVIIPTRNEECHIKKCLESVLNSKYPHDRMEVLVVDGMSEDSSREIITKFSSKYPFIKLLDNTKKIVPTALNIGIGHSRGEVIVRMDAHAEYPQDYISKLVEWLERSGADNVGGVCFTCPANKSATSEAISIALSHPLGVGNSYFRVGVKEPKFVDTVPFGAFQRGVFDKVGLFDEELIRNQDDEFNYRITKSGGKILLVPEITCKYYARESIRKVFRQYFQYGYWKIRVIQKHKLPASWRHLVPVGFLISILISALLAVFYPVGMYLLFTILTTYTSALLLVSFPIAARKGINLCVLLPLAFSAVHLGYGMGFIRGFWDFIIRKRHLKKKIEYMEITR